MKYFRTLVLLIAFILIPGSVFAHNDNSRQSFNTSRFGSFPSYNFPYGNTHDPHASAVKKDKTPPSIAQHANITVTAEDRRGATVTYTAPTATDTHDGPVAVSCTPESGSRFPIGKTTVRCSARDAAGNSVKDSFLVIVKAPAPSQRDYTPPKILSLRITSNNSNPSVAVPGDKVTISFTASEEVMPIVLVESRALFAKAKNTGGNSWEASYIVGPKDKRSKVDYLITLKDTSRNAYTCSSARVPFVAYCPTTDGSSVTVIKAPTTPPADTVAPVVSSHDPVTVDAEDESGATVTYEAPTAIDAHDGPVAVSCTPESGSVFPAGDTTVQCTAQDAAGNTASRSFVVTVNPFVPPDTTPPTIEEHEDIEAEAEDNDGVAVEYDLPVATDDSGSASVSCTPESGSVFPVGDTEVACVARDAAGNEVSTSFTVSVYPAVFEPQPFVIASQTDESSLCAPDWRECYTDGGPETVVDLGKGSDLGDGSIFSVTVAKDPTSPYVSQKWLIFILCYTDAAHTATCPDWIAPNAWNSGQTHLLSEFTTATTDNTHWTAYFTNPENEKNFDGSSPVVFNPDYYYTLVINDNGWNIGAYGNGSEPYWVLTGMTTP